MAATGLTAEQKVDLAWLNGWRARFAGQPRPAGLVKAEGWDAADGLIKAAQSHGGGGYA